MIKNFVRALAFAAGSLFAALPATAATFNVVGGVTEIEVTADLGALGLSALPFGTASLSNGAVAIPITGGSVAANGDAIIEHDGGGVGLFSMSAAAFVGDFVIDTGEATVFGRVNGGSDFADLFTLGDETTDGIPLFITDTLAGALTAVFGAPNLSGAQFGLANTAPEVAPVPLPAAGWLLLAGVGGLAVMRRRAKANAA